MVSVSVRNEPAKEDGEPSVQWLPDEAVLCNSLNLSHCNDCVRPCYT